jgi:hypothetical protein
MESYMLKNTILNFMLFFAMSSVVFAQVDADKYQYIGKRFEPNDGYSELHESRGGSKKSIRIFYNNQNEKIRKQEFLNDLIVQDDDDKGGIHRTFKYDKDNRLAEIDIIETPEKIDAETISKQLYKIKYVRNKDGKIQRIYKEYDETSVHGGEEGREIFLEYNKNGELIKKEIGYEEYVEFLAEKDRPTEFFTVKEKIQKTRLNKNMALKSLGIIKVVVGKINVTAQPSVTTKDEIEIKHKRNFDNRRYLVFKPSDGSLRGEAKWAKSRWTIFPVKASDVWLLVPQKVVEKKSKHGVVYTSIEEGYIRKRVKKANGWEIYDKNDKLLYEVEVSGDEIVSAKIKNQDTYDFTDAVTEEELGEELDKVLRAHQSPLEKIDRNIKEALGIEEAYREFFKKESKK